MSSTRPPRPQRSALALAAVLGGAFLFAGAARVPVLTPDVWWHLATGRYIASNGFPRQDPFSYTLADRDWTAHEWLADRAMYAVFARSGPGGVVAVRAALVVLAFAAAYGWARRRGTRIVSLALIAIAAYASQRNWIDRPQLCSFVFLPVVLHALDRHRSGARWVGLWFLPIVFLLWVNVHGGFLLGFGLVLLALLSRWVERRDPKHCRELAIVVALSAAATLANPNGLNGAVYPLRYVGSGLRATIAEEQAGSLDSPFAYAHFGLVLILGVTLAGRWRRIALEQKVAALVLAWISMPRLGGFELPFAAERHAPLFLVGAVPIAAQEITAWAGDGWRRFEDGLEGATRGGAVWVGSLVLVAYTGWEIARGLPRDSNRILPGRFPEAATRWLAQAELPGHLVNPYRWGGYLAFHLWPEYRVWIDSRGDLYGAERLAEEELLYRMPAGDETAAQALLDHYDANVVVWYLLTLDFGDLRLHPFARWMLERPEWRLVFYDAADAARPGAPWATTAVFLREHERNAVFLQRYPRRAPPPGLPR